MSRCSCQSYKPVYGYGGYDKGNCCCSFPTLVILILIVLQFGKKGFGKDHDYDDYKDNKLVDNGILFIIALFYLSCCVKCH